MAKKIEDLDKNFQQAGLSKDASGIKWHSAIDKKFTVRGLAWFEENGKEFMRLPKRAEKIVPEPVWSLAQSPSSARVCFKTDSTRLSLKMENTRCANMLHFAVTGSDGVFIYEGAPHLMKPWNMMAPYIGQTKAEKEIATKLPPAMREFTIYLPLYAPLASLEIGLDTGAKIQKPTPHRLDKPVVFYGSSITQGGCASTSGGDFISAVGRKLDIDVVNLGFSGNGRGEPEMAQLIAEIDASAYVLDYAANSHTTGLKATLSKFISILRGKHPATPIILVSRIHWYPELVNADARREIDSQRDVILREYINRKDNGDANLHFVDGHALIYSAEDFALVDGVHPTSQGFYLMAERLAPALAHVMGL